MILEEPEIVNNQSVSCILTTVDKSMSQSPVISHVWEVLTLCICMILLCSVCYSYPGAVRSKVNSRQALNVAAKVQIYNFAD